MKLLIALTLFVSVCAFAQYDGITSSASASLTLAADEADISLSVTADIGTTQDQVIQTLQPLGITAQNLTGISFGSGYYSSSGTTTTGTIGPSQVSYGFAFTVPYARTKATVDALEALGKSFLANNQSFQYSLYASASQAAIDQARQQAIPDLIAQAKKRAQFLASSSQVALGGIASISDSALSSSGYYVASPGYNSGVSGISVTFSVTVRFKIQ